MAPALVPDTLWEIIEPILPLPKPKPQGGRPRMPDSIVPERCTAPPIRPYSAAHLASRQPAYAGLFTISNQMH